MITFGPEVCTNLDAGLACEWLETNGIGGFASSTVPGVNTRRYHGLLTAALHPPVDRYVLLSRMEETVFLNGAKYDLSANIYPGTIHPNGHTHMKSFRLDPFPVFTYAICGVEIEKRVFMVHGENSTVVEYSIVGPGECTIEVRPLIAFRDYHSTTHANQALNGELEQSQGEVSVHPYAGLPRLFFAHNAGRVEKEGSWYYNFEYPRESERGLDSGEDLFQPFVMQFRLGGENRATVIASTAPHDVAAADELRNREVARRASLRAQAPVDDPLVGDLTAAADQFIVVRSGNLSSVIAGYHWFADWGRDTMIALPGLTLVTGRFDIARDILLAFSRATDRGMLPNRFPDLGETPEYNTVDASLWYFEAIRKYLEYTGDFAFVREHLYETMKSILDWHLRGTRFGIICGPDGLIAAGGPDTQLTWMDARIGDYVVTPRNGKPVEIQALWYNALRVTESLAARFGDSGEENLLAGVAARTEESFNRNFWNERDGCLFDVVDGEYHDAAVRPNQAIALSLGYTMVSSDRAAKILEVLERDLLTPVGLRSVAACDPRYRRQYKGASVERESSYHQGTVWPWLLGSFITAYVRAHEGSPAARDQAGKWLEGFHAHLRTAGLGSISEIFDADAPHEPRGCVAQAWSVAEVLRALVEDVHAVRPLAEPRPAAAHAAV